MIPDSKEAQTDGHPVPREWNGTTVPFPRGRTVLEFFREQVQTRPENVAVRHGQQAMTYKELDVKSGRVASELRRHGLQPAEPVMILLPASCEFLAAVVGVLKAGGTYFPVDTETPGERLNYLVGDCGARLVLSDASGVGRFRDSSARAMELSEIIGSTPAEDDRLDAAADPARRAYITYTSGSTGRPKGVEIEHHCLSNLVCYYHRRLNLSARDRASMLAYVAFDASVADIWPVLCAGGVLSVPPKGLLLNPDELIAWLAAEEITLTFVPTGLAEILFARPWPERMKLRYLITGGDRLRVRPPAGLPFVVINGYGPTENTVFSTWSEVMPDDGQPEAPPIGRPLDNTTAYVLDEQLRPVAIQTAGELYLGGEQVARGYLGRVELTNERFLPDPFAGQAGARMYRTGDWARWLPDGQLEFLGRKDGQIQIRGRRVELGEIEATLFAHGAVRQVCCVPWLDNEMPAGVIAHIVPEAPDATLLDDLRSYLQSRLPDYMVPSRFELHDSFPLTPQGKVDRAFLTALQPGKSPVAQIAAKDGLVLALAALWQSLLPAAAGLPREATFSELGGDSLLAMKLMIGVEEIIGQRLEISSFLVQPTFSGLCLAVKARMSRINFQPVLTLRKQGNRPPLFLLYGHSGDLEQYFSLTEALGDDQPVLGIRSPALEDVSMLPQSIETAATAALHSIRKVQPNGAPALAGYCLAGVLAFEVARQLAHAEGIDCFTALIGTPAPIRPISPAYRLAHFARHFPPWLWHLALDHENRGRRLARWREMIRDLKPNLTQVPGEPMPEWASSPVSRHLIGLMEKYRPSSRRTMSLDLFRGRDEHQAEAHPMHPWTNSYKPDAGWQYWTRRRNRVHWIEGDHQTIIEPPLVSGLAQSIRQAMDRHFKSHLPSLETGADRSASRKV